MGHEQLVELAGPTTAGHVEGSASALLRRTRGRRGWSQRELAVAAYVPHSTVARIEAGTMQPTIPTLQQLLIAMGYEMRIRLDHFDDHDRVLDERARRFPERHAALEAGLDRVTATRSGGPDVGR
jgi:transcriptional regulator with XRE-family HTH domain